MTHNFLLPLTGSFAQPAAENPTVAMIEAAYQHHGLDWRYINVEVAPDDLADAVRGARAMGWRGFNCSIPHKVAVIEHLDGLGKSAEIIGAVNTIVRDGDRFTLVAADRKPERFVMPVVHGPVHYAVLRSATGAVLADVPFATPDQRGLFRNGQPARRLDRHRGVLFAAVPDLGRAVARLTIERATSNGRAVVGAAAGVQLRTAANTTLKVKTIRNSGPSSQCVDLVVLGDGYGAGHQAKFNSDAAALDAVLFGVHEPYKTYAKRFNVHTVFQASPTGTTVCGNAGNSIKTAYGITLCQDATVIMPAGLNAATM